MKSTQRDYAPPPKVVCWSCNGYAKRAYRVQIIGGRTVKVCQSCYQSLFKPRH